MEGSDRGELRETGSRNYVIHRSDVSVAAAVGRGSLPSLLFDLAATHHLPHKTLLGDVIPEPE